MTAVIQRINSFSDSNPRVSITAVEQLTWLSMIPKWSNHCIISCNSWTKLIKYQQLRWLSSQMFMYSVYLDCQIVDLWLLRYCDNKPYQFNWPNMINEPFRIDNLSCKTHVKQSFHENCTCLSTKSIPADMMQFIYNLDAINSIDAHCFFFFFFSLPQYMEQTTEQIKETITDCGRVKNILEGIFVFKLYMHIQWYCHPSRATVAIRTITFVFPVRFSQIPSNTILLRDQLTSFKKQIFCFVLCILSVAFIKQWKFHNEIWRCIDLCKWNCFVDRH